MELLQLKYFCDAAKSQNFSKTARKFIVPPSNISQSIKRLEAELGTSLFIRRANSIILSEQGEKFYKRVSRALELIGEGVSVLSDNGATGAISIFINSNRRVIKSVIESFKQKFPGVTIKVTYFDTSDTEEYNLIIDGENPNLSGYRRELLISEDIALAVNAENPLAAIEKVDVALLRDEPFITMDKSSSLCKTTRAICRDFGFEPRIALQSDDPHFIRKCVQLGLGITFVPTISWKGEFPDSVVLKNLGYKRNTYVYVNEKSHLPLCVKNFLDMLLSQRESFG